MLEDVDDIEGASTTRRYPSVALCPRPIVALFIHLRFWPGCSSSYMDACHYCIMQMSRWTCASVFPCPSPSRASPLLSPPQFVHLPPSVTLPTARLTVPVTLLNPPTTILPPCLPAVLPKLSRSKTAGVGVNRARLLDNGELGDMGGVSGSNAIPNAFVGPSVGPSLPPLPSRARSYAVIRGVVSDDPDPPLRRLTITGKSVKAERNTSLAINTGSLNKLVKLSPCSSISVLALVEVVVPVVATS